MPRPSEPELRSSGGDEARRAVEAVLLEQAEREARLRDRATLERARRSARRGGAPMVGVTLLLAVVSVSIWTSPPAWARPEPFPDPTPQRMEAGLRMDMWIAVQRIQVFRDQARRLPVLLEEAVADPAERADLRYERPGGDDFRLVGSRDGIVVTYDSSQPPETLTDEAREVLEAGVGR